MTSAGMGYAYMAATVLGLTSAYSARFTRQAGRKRTGISLFAASLCACLVLAMLPLPFPSIAGILVLRLCDSLFQPFQTEIQNEMLQTPYRATALSLNAMLTNGVAIGTNLAYGALAQYSLSLAFCFGAALCATGLGLYLGMAPPREPESQCVSSFTGPWEASTGPAPDGERPAFPARESAQWHRRAHPGYAPAQSGTFP